MAEESQSERARAVLAGLAPGARLAGYQVESKIGAGGMAIVFRAHDEALGRTVALKVLAPGLADDTEFRERFVRESRAVAAVDHLHIIPVYAAGEAEGALYLAMRFVASGDLRSVIRREGQLTADRVAFLLSPVASALDAAHAWGLVHRDVKPANILVDGGHGRPEHPYLSDFGLAKRTSSTTILTEAGQFLGTPDYAAPEQISGGAARPQTDQYALACVAFTALTGSLPFARGDSMAVLWAHMHEPPPSVCHRRRDLPAAADTVLARALSKAPGERYGTCSEFAEALRAALDLPAYGGSAPGLVATGPTPARAAGRPAPQPMAASGISPPEGPQEHQPGAARVNHSTRGDTEPAHGTRSSIARRAADVADGRDGTRTGRIAGAGTGRRGAPRPVAGERRQPQHRVRKRVLIGGAVAVVLAAAGTVTALVLPGSGPGAVPGSTPATSPPAKPRLAAATPGPRTLTPVSVQTFNPYGMPPGNTEDSSTASYAVDRYADTAWTTSYYFNNPQFDGLKPGAGLLIDMGKPVTLSSATVTFGSVPGADVRIEVGNSAVDSIKNLTTFVTVAAKNDVGGSCTFPAAVKITGRFVLIWFTKLPPAKIISPNIPPGARTYQASIYNVILRG